jgi:hypothetical protein
MYAIRKTLTTEERKNQENDVFSGKRMVKKISESTQDPCDESERIKAICSQIART